MYRGAALALHHNKKALPRIRCVPPVNENTPELPCFELSHQSELLRKERELLAKARETAQRIVRRVRKTLEDTGSHQSLPTEENPPLA